jgi:hypothetical protein
MYTMDVVCGRHSVHSKVSSPSAGISMGFASSLAFKTHMLRSDDSHSPLESNMVSVAPCVPSVPGVPFDVCRQ